MPNHGLRLGRLTPPVKAAPVGQKREMKTKIYGILSATSFLLAIVSFLGVWQAADLFTGERASFNIRFWGSATILFLLLTFLLAVLAIRASKRLSPLRHPYTEEKTPK
jgi:hypothetical protein